jgi:hypothetical protein
MGRFRFGHWRVDPHVAPATDRHSVAEVVRVPLDQVQSVVDALEPAGIVATGRPTEGPDADATLASVLVLAGEVDRAQWVLRRAGLISDT